MHFDRSADNHRAFQPLFLTDFELADILVVKVPWLRGRAGSIPGFIPMGVQYRFSRQALERWLGNLDRLLLAQDIANLFQLRPKWVYENADTIRGVLRLGRYVRFRPAIIHGIVDERDLVGPDLVE